VQAFEGKFIRGGDLTKQSIALSNPIIVDTASGVIREGNLAPRQWIIKQRATPDAFFIVIMHPEEPGLANVKFTLIPEGTHPITFIYDEFSVLLTGTCVVIG
jgi:hypothetical protein